MDDYRGQDPVPDSTPRDRRSEAVRSMACSHVAVRLRHPANTPVTAIPLTHQRWTP